MLDDQIRRIKAALEAGPTPGVWEYREVDGLGSVAAPKGWVGAVVADRGHECIDANYIAACNPVAIRALLDRLKAAEAEIERLRDALGAVVAYRTGGLIERLCREALEATDAR